jgi:hypothetical protein
MNRYLGRCPSDTAVVAGGETGVRLSDKARNHWAKATV